MTLLARTKPRDKYEGMNGLERSFAERLEADKLAGKIHEWFYERVTLKLADDCRYTCDFVVIENDGLIVFAETKGRWEDDALVKIKVAAQTFPFQFQAWQKLPKKQGGGWTRRDFHAVPG